MTTEQSYVIKRCRDYYLKPLMYLFSAVVVLIILWLVFVAELFIIVDLDTFAWFGIIYLIASLLCVLIFAASLALLITAFIVTAPRKLILTEGSITYHSLTKEIVIPRTELASVRICQESSWDIKHNIATVYLRSEKDEIINFGRIDSQNKIAAILRKYAKDVNYNAVKALQTELN